MSTNKHTERINELDYLRGFALLGIILVNIISLLNIPIPSMHTIDASYQRFLFLFVEGRFFTIFSFLFGVGFYIFMKRASEKRANAYLLYARRMICLCGIGLIHSIYNSGETLVLYATFGFLLLPFLKVKKEINVLIGLILLGYFSLIAAKAAIVFPMMLLGLVAGQFKMFETLQTKKKELLVFTLFAGVFSLSGLWYQYTKMPAVPFDTWILSVEGGELSNQMIETNTFLKTGLLVGPIVSALYMGIFLLLLQTKLIRKIFAPLKYYGRMALTNYIGQTLLILTLGNSLHLTRNISYFQTIYLCIGICIIQIIFSVIWIKSFKLGPLEWMWRNITYWRIISLKKK